MALLNLAREPFVNARPLRRICVVLTALAAILLLINGFLFWGYLSGSAGLRGQLRDIRADISAERQAIDGLRAQVTGYDLRSQNEQAEFLNYQIRQRTFGWSLLFERLGEVLPNKVKISTLSPSLGEANDARVLRASETDDVVLSVRGTSADSDNLLDLLDRLFAHPAFRSPRLLSENRDESGEITFELSTRYLPAGSPSDSTEADPMEGAVDGDGDDSAEEGDESPAIEGEQYTERSVADGSEPSSGLVADSEPPPRDPRGTTAPTVTAQRPVDTSQTTRSGGTPADSSAPRGTTLRPPSDVDRGSRANTSTRPTASDRRPRPRPATGSSRFQPGRSQPRPVDDQSSPRNTPASPQLGVPAVPVLPTRNASSPGGGR